MKYLRNRLTNLPEIFRAVSINPNDEMIPIFKFLYKTYVGEFGTDFVYQIIPAANNHWFWAAGIIWYTKLVPNSPTYVGINMGKEWEWDYFWKIPKNG